MKDSEQELLLEAPGGYTFATTISAGNRVTVSVVVVRSSSRLSRNRVTVRQQRTFSPPALVAYHVPSNVGMSARKQAW